MLEELTDELEELINVLKKKNDDDDDERAREIIDDILNRPMRDDIKEQFIVIVKDYKNYLEEDQTNLFIIQKLTKLQDELEEQLDGIEEI